MHWYPRGQRLPTALTRDARWRGVGQEGDLVARAAELGYDVVMTEEELAANLEQSRRLAAATGRCSDSLLARNFSSRQQEGLGAVYDPPVSLADLTAAAIEILSRNPNGFFLMVEESRHRPHGAP